MPRRSLDKIFREIHECLKRMEAELRASRRSWRSLSRTKRGKQLGKADTAGRRSDRRLKSLKNKMDHHSSRQKRRRN